MAALAHQFSGLSELRGWPQRLKALLAEELAPRPRKFVTSLRLTVIATIGVGLVAVCHVNSELGAYIVWLVVGAGPMMRPSRATAILIAEAAMLAASVVMARALAETPWLMLPFVFTFMAISTFIATSRKLASAGLLIQVVSLASFYGVVFGPHEIGWAAAGNFGGSAVAFGLLVLFDNWLWPDPAEPILIEQLRASAVRHRRRLIGAARFYLNAGAARRPEEPPPTSDLPQHLALLDRAIVEGVPVHRRALLLAAVTRMARIELEIDNVIVAARENVPHRVRATLQPEAEAVVEAIAAALEEIAQDASTLLRSGVDQPAFAAALRARRSIDALSARVKLVRPSYIREVGSAEVTNFSSFTDCLGTLTRLLERPLDGPPPHATFNQMTRAAPQTSGTRDPMLLRYSLKVGLTAVAGYVIGLASQRPELSVILTTIVITALPTYGASLRKMILRIIGAALGGVISLLAIILVTPNFETLPAYLLAVFAVLYTSAYSSLSSGRIAYAGKQIGTTYLLVFAGLSPSAEIYTPLWRIWGILLGTVVTAVVFFLFWPEYAGASLLPRLRKVMRDTIALIPGGPSAVSERAIEAASSGTIQALAEILGIADDARLEGRACQIDDDAVVHAAGTLRRIANRLAGISMGRITVKLPRLDAETELAHHAVIRATRLRLERWLAYLDNTATFRDGAALILAEETSDSEMTRSLARFSDLLEAQGFARINAWTLEERRTILSELDSLSRLEFLMTELDRYLPAVTWPAAEPTRRSDQSRSIPATSAD
jgi:uncharacterized membrane protein YccC